YYLTRFPSYTIIYGAFATIPIFLLWMYMSWLVILLGATITALLPALRQRRWAQQHYVGANFVDSIRVLQLLWQARTAPTPGQAVEHLCVSLGLHPDALDHVPHALEPLGSVVNPQDDDTDRWAMACAPHHATPQPLIDARLLGAQQPAPACTPPLVQAVWRPTAGA